MVARRPRRPARNTRPASFRFDQYKFLDELSGSDAEPGDSATGVEIDQEQDVDPEPDLDKPGDEFIPEDVDYEEADDPMSDAEDEEVEDEEDANASAETDLERDESIIDANSDREAQFSATADRTQRGVSLSTSSRHDVAVRTRGVEDWRKGSQGQAVRIKDLFGPTLEDLKPVFLTKDHWEFHLTFPNRSQGHLRRSFFVPEGAAMKEAKATWKWYDEVGREAFATAQRSRELTEQEADAYMDNPGPDTINLLMGHVQNPQVYTLRKGRYMEVDRPFGLNSSRRGWIFNLGSRVQEAQWVPGPKQYLAVAVEQTRTNRLPNKPLENPNAPAFSATAPFPGSIQIWAFDALENGDMDPAQQPRLEQVICTNWGAPKQFRWWPFEYTESADRPGDVHRLHFGLLAGIWSDGKLRILDVYHCPPGPESRPTRYVHYFKTAFEVSFPETVPSCLHWLSPTTLAAGTASGHLAAWTLTHAGIFRPSTAQDTDTFTPRPWMYKLVADTYILTLTSGYPSRPQYISISSADGFTRLLDIRDPVIDACSSIRNRMLTTTQAWHEHIQAFIMPDEYYLLKANSIRRYYANIYSMRLDAPISYVASSPIQPCVLLGGADGTVLASNPIAKVLHHKAVPWQQPWFKHEWRPPVDKLEVKVRVRPAPNDNVDSVADTAQGESEVPPELLAAPMVRITEGYRPQKPGMGGADAFARYKEGAKLLTIFEEKSCITKLVWNPNLKYGTWAAAGMGSGLLRVEDVGLDEDVKVKLKRMKTKKKKEGESDV